MRRRGELIERSFAHAYETGAMRRLHLRHRDNVAKRVLIHTAGFNLGLLMRVKYGLLKPRRLSDAVDRALTVLISAWRWLIDVVGCLKDRRQAMGAGSTQTNGSLELQAA